MICKDINKLSLTTGQRCREFLSKCKEQNLSVAINETLRYDDTQAIYVMQGRLPVAEVNYVRKLHGFWELTSDEGKRYITWTVDSKHLKGEAFDAVPLDAKGNTWWNAPQSVWEHMGEIGESIGLKWGGRWKNTDSPHFEM